MKKIPLIVICLIVLVGCSWKNNSENKSDEKIIAELEYCSTKLVDIMNKLNNISLENYELIENKVKISQETEKSTSAGGEAQSSSSQTSEQSTGENQEVSVTEMKKQSLLNKDTEQVDWNLLRSEIEVINSYWSVVMLDLYDANISNEDIINFGNTLNQCTLSINSEDKINTLVNVATLYSYMPKFLKDISVEQSIQNIQSTQSHILMAYVEVNRDDWKKVSDNLLNAETTFITLLNDSEYSKHKEYKINKTYMAIKDLQNSIQIQDKSLFFLKYKNVMESLNTL